MNIERNKITDEKLKEFKKIFDSFDINADFTISTSELGEALKLLGSKPTETELKAIIDEFDQDQSGHINFSEFTNIVTSQLNSSNSDEDLKEALKIIDRDQDGYISCADLILLMTSIGDKITLEEAKEIINEIDPKGDGFIKCTDLLRNKSDK